MAKESWHYHWREGKNYIRSGTSVEGKLQIETRVGTGQISYITFGDHHDAAVFLASAAESFGLRAVVADDTGEAVRPEESK